jgi:hypothetical protein
MKEKSWTRLEELYSPSNRANCHMSNNPKSFGKADGSQDSRHEVLVAYVEQIAQESASKKIRLRSRQWCTSLAFLGSAPHKAMRSCFELAGERRERT